MFRKLQLQFILTNLTILTVLFVALTLGAYILLEIKMLNHAEFFAKNMADGINAGMAYPEELPGSPPKEPRFFDPPNEYSGFRPPLPLPDAMRDHGRHESFFFFIKVDPQGNVLDHSIRFPVRITQINQIARRTVSTNKANGVIWQFHSKFYYYKTALQHEAGTLLIFLDLGQDRQNQRSLVISLVIIGGVCLILAFFGSVFMAHRAVEPIQKAWRQQKEFLADASHELRNPLAVIQTNLDVIVGNRNETVAEQREWLGNIRDELRQMTGLVTSLLFLARMDSHQRVMDKKWFELDGLLRRVFEAFKPVATAQNINLEIDLSGRVVVFGDEAAFRQVMENLLDNAVRHTPNGGMITLKLEQTVKKIMLTVADTGEGIDARYLPKIFDRFYQVDYSRSKGKSGLGLAIAKSIVENHEGTIQATSQPGVGTTFTIHLPVVKEACPNEAGNATVVCKH